jgi:xylulokinase
MRMRIISYDLGTSGNKASLYDADGRCLASAFVPYPTHYPRNGWHEQSPEDWWDAVVASTRKLLAESGEAPERIACIGISGHSLGAVPLDRNGRPIRATTPIWSDTRAVKEAEQFFRRVDEREWYMTTGNGFPPHLYTVFKVMWYRENEPELFRNTRTIIGTKDYINLRLTGVLKTDPSYASGSGVYNLRAGGYDRRLLEASGIPEELFPDIVPSTAVLGELLPEAARQLGLPEGVKVVCGGVDNSCMALGAKNIESGRVYTSLGSSAWIAVSSDEPVLDLRARPYVFAHVIPGMFTSAVSIFSAGTSLRWVRDQLCGDLVAEAECGGKDAYDLMTALAEQAPPGANRLLFNPSLAGGTSLDASVNIRGAYIGLDLKHTRADLIRACMEGIAMNLRLNLDVLREHCALRDEMLLVGGGSKSRLYRTIFADVYNMNIVKTNVDQDAGALGAAAIAAVGCGLWDDFRRIDELHRVEEVTAPDRGRNAIYEKLLPVFRTAAEYQARIGDALQHLDLS